MGKVWLTARPDAASNKLSLSHGHEGARGGAIGWGTALQADSIPESVTGIFRWHNPSGRPGVDLAPDRNEYQEYVFGVKAAGA